MVHLRAKNLPEKGTIEEWLFQDDLISSGQDFALIKTESGQEVIIKSHLEGVVVKTVKIGSVVKNGSILANIAVGPKEIARFKNRHFKEGQEEIIPELEEGIDVESDSLNRLASAEDDLDNISGAVMYDRNYQANTPFSTGDELMDTPEKYKKIVERDEAIMAEPSKPAGNGTLQDRFAQMRANIASSIKNSPNAKALNLSAEEKSKLASMSNEDALKSGNLFSTDNAAGVSKFRQLVNSRKEKLLEDNDFKEVKDEDLHVDAMSKVDDKGRPLIMRNIIANRLEQFNKSGGDPDAVQKEIVATKDNAVKNFVKPNPSEILHDGEPKYIRPDKNEETPAMYKAERSKVVDTSVKDSPFARQRASEDGDFGVTFGGYVDDGELDVDLNEVTNSGATMLPSKKQDELLNEIKQKSEKTYAESKLANLYDSNRRWEIIKSRNDVSEINRRRQLMEKGKVLDDSHIEKVGADKIGNTPIPDIFLRQTIVQNDSGKVDYVQYKDTPKGKEEFENWLRSANLYAIYKDAQEDPAMREENSVASPNPSYEQRVEQSIVQSVTQPLPQQQETQSNTASEKQNQDSNALEFLKEQVLELKKALESKNKLEAAETTLKKEPTSTNTDQSFTQMMQLMMMQNMMNQNHTQNVNSTSDIKKMIQEQLDEFKTKLLQETNAQINANKNYEKTLNKPIVENQNIENNQELKNIQTKSESENLNHVRPNEEIASVQKKEQESNILQREAINPNSLPAVKSMILSQSYIPPLTISTEVDMTSILKLKHVLKKTDPGTLYSTILFIAKALSIALSEYPKINSSYDPETNEVLVKAYHNIGLATETSEGLIIPVLKFVEKLSLKELAIDIQEMTARLRRGELYNYETSGSTITLANYGNIGAIQATPTIFYPNAAVVGVGKVVKKPVVVENEKLAIKAMMNVSLTVDQRIIDNATAGRFLARIKEILEKPELITVS